MTKYLFLLLFLVSCGNVSNESLVIKNQQIDSKIYKDSQQLQLDKNMINSIKDYYKGNFGNNASLSESQDDSTLNLSFFSISDIEDEESNLLISILIPLTSSQELYGAIPILTGDLNNDSNDDLVVSVYTEAGNSASQDIFTFISQDENFNLVNVSNDKELCGCNGSFRALRIEDNHLIGQSSCYSEQDAMCCPSLNYETKVALTDNKLVFVSKKEMK